MSSTADLFGTPGSADRRQALLDVFERWIAGREQSTSPAKGQRALREDSADVYRDMWVVFADWCVRHACDLPTVDEHDLEAFLGSLGGARDVTLRYAKRMLQLIGRIDQADAASTGREPNPGIAALKARPRYRYGDGAADEPLPEFLTAGETRTLIDYVTARQSAPGAAEVWSWQEVRNRTAVAIQLGAGITPGEARTLTLGQIVVEGGYRRRAVGALASRQRQLPARQTPLSAWAGRQLAFWVRVRGQQGIPGEMVFPATRSGKEWSKASSINGFRAVLQGAGIRHPGRCFVPEAATHLRVATADPASPRRRRPLAGRPGSGRYGPLPTGAVPAGRPGSSRPRAAPIAAHLWWQRPHPPGGCCTVQHPAG